MSKRETHCRECGKALTPEQMKKGAFFCSPEHRKAFNNRRMVRGAELYDIWMANNYERDLRSTHNLLSTMSNLGRAYRDADKAFRDGRKSWNAKETLDRLPLAFGREGDKR